MLSIRIVATPAGEAPEEIRKAWIGLVLPLREGIPNAVISPMFGVLTGPKNILGQLFKMWFGKQPRREAYMVIAKDAIELLAQHNPTAAQWWRENTPHYVTSTKWLLSFEKEVCEPIA